MYRNPAMQLSKREVTEFHTTVWQFYKQRGRSTLPWRVIKADGTCEPYKILVSEVMLQQTQVSRVIPKFQEFLKRFPTIQSLADAQLSEVLRVWSGLGYYRRAKFLHSAAQIIQDKFNGHLPRETEELYKLPGIGKNTAAAIKVYSFNVPEVFIETNIRTVYIHSFFTDSELVTDSMLLPIIKATLDTAAPREWYWALMDYGSYLKTAHPNPSRRSKHHTSQATFKGSNRQLRGAILKLLTDQNLTAKELRQSLLDSRLDTVLTDLMNDGLISKNSDVYSLG